MSCVSYSNDHLIGVKVFGYIKIEYIIGLFYSGAVAYFLIDVEGVWPVEGFSNVRTSASAPIF